MDSRRSTGIITSIQLLRILAAVAVVIVHAEPSFKVGPSGVDIFFVISGFVILVSSRHLFGTKGGWRTFLKNRIIRVVPLYWVATAVTIALLFAIGGYVPSLERILSSLFFIPYSDPTAVDKNLPVLSVGWTLNCEMFFYAIFAAAAALPIRKATAAIVISICALVFIPTSESFPTLSLYWSSPMLFEFIFGIVIAWIYLLGFRLPPIAGAFVAAAGLATIYLNRDVGSSPDMFHRLLVWGAPAALIVASAAITRWPSLGAMSVKATQYLGAASYAVYLFHPLVIMVTEPLPLWAKVAVSISAGAAIHAMEKLVRRSIRGRHTTLGAAVQLQ